MRAIELADAPQPAQHVRYMTAEDAAIRVQLVEHDKTQVLEQLHPLRVMGEDPGVEHVRVRDDDVTRTADRRAHRGRRVAVVRVGLELDVDVRGLALELRELVLRERLRREDVERARAWVLRDRVEDRQVVAKRFTRGRRRYDDGVTSRMRRLERRGLVRIELVDAAPTQGRGDASLEPFGERRIARRARGHALPPRDQLLELAVGGERVEDLLEARPGREPNGRSHKAEHDMERAFERQPTPDLVATLLVVGTATAVRCAEVTSCQS